MCYTVKMKLEGNTLSLNYCVELFNSLEYLYIVFLFVSDLLELLQTILKTSRLC